ncbi:HD domain-containing protein [Caenispirillum bisanense]|uniref:Putative hydrolases of HD superfamily n=1 Tax=Caenispirillum bisanense TaxID=414052 RepID=A0A286G609_9PROT|nr:HD domain-containing protein [Caenispirillum bisanense]SOD90414.1 putative hydrolases of HD superfamily [Caenispirillum bisanense]
MVGAPDRLQRILDFLEFADRFKFVERRGYLTGGERRENDAEHCWHMALVAMVLHGELEDPASVDLGKALRLILVHDLVEIEAGDTYAYDDAAIEGQEEREQRAADRIFGLLPDDLGAEMRALWEEFEARETPEARFAKACDNFQGFMQNVISGGRAWRENGVGREDTRRRTDFPRTVDPAFDALLTRLYARTDREGSFG